MADNIQLDEGTSGKYALTDDVGSSRHAQGFKLCYSADGVATFIDADAFGLKTQGWYTGEPSHYNGRFTTAQTGTNLITGVSGDKIYLTKLSVGTGGATAALVTFWYDLSAETVFATGTDPCIWEGKLAPNTDGYPGFVMGGSGRAFSVSGAYDCLKLTTDAAITLYVQAEYYIL